MSNPKLTRSEKKRLGLIVTQNASFAKLINYFKKSPREMLRTLNAMDKKFQEAIEDVDRPEDIEGYGTDHAYYVSDWETHYDRLTAECEEARNGDQ